MADNMIDENFIMKADKKLSDEGIPLYQRPIRVGLMWLKEQKIIGDIISPEIKTPIENFYKKFYKSKNFSFPPILKGGVLIRGCIYLANVYLSYGSFSIDPLKCIEISSAELNLIYKQDKMLVGSAIYSVLDLWDFAYGIDDLKERSKAADQLWHNAKSSIHSTASLLSDSCNINAALQSICLSVELSLKGCLAFLDIPECRLRKLGHDNVKLVDELISLRPSSSDNLLRNMASTFPDYVKTRYQAHELSRIQLMKLFVKSQFIAAEALRRVSERNLVKELEPSIKNDYDVTATTRFKI